MEAIRDVLPRTAALIADDFAAEQHKGFQLYVSREGGVVAKAASGQASPDLPMTRDTLVNWLSSGKPLTTLAIGLLWERGELSLDDPVVRFIPEFAAGGKEGVTVRHLLTHTGGFPRAEAGYPQFDWQESIARIARSPLEEDWQIGRTAGYHPTSSWFILGEIISRIAGTPFAHFIKEEITGALELSDVFFQLSEQDQDNPAIPMGWLWRRLPGHPLKACDWHVPPRLTRASPGSSARGPIHELGRFYERMLSILEGSEGIVRPQTVEAMTAAHRVGQFDRTFRQVIDFGLGFLVNPVRSSDEPIPYGFGAHASRRAFGHGGSQSSIGFADPEYGLVVAWAANAMIGEPRHNRRNWAINTAIYEDLGLDR